ncbi:MAG: sulfatase [Alphaproteobacteria bacterium]|nr:sulfatase [Alphaproteobacteria bacterium]MCB9793432.1 sulfatase [Alphaproteobacteria bacterium]
MRRHLLAHLAPLAAFLGVELVFAHGAVARPAAWQLGAEALGLGALGFLWWRFAPEGEARSLAWPAVLPVLLTGLVYRPEGWVHGFLFAVGALVLAGVMGRVIEERLSPGPALAVGLAALSGVLVRYQVLEGSDVRDARQQLLVELSDPWPAAGEARSDGPPLVLISVDTLRWDHAVEMNSWRRLSERGVGWERAMATSSWTLPSMSSVMTGLPAERHGAGAGPAGYSTATATTLAEELQAAGYATAAFVTNPFCSRDTGLDRGFGLFQHVYERAPHRLLLAGLPAGPHVEQAELIVDRALGWLEDAPAQGFFLWVHLLEPHLPYRHLPPGDPLSGWQRGDVRGGRVLDEATREAVRAAYAHEVAVADAQIERLLDALERWPDALVVFVADHGEELWDHGDVEHGHSHHGEVVDVALAVSGPGVAVGHVGQGVASLVDVAPTLRGAAGLPPQGHDLRFGVPPDRIATAFGNKYDRVDRSARQGDLRIIQEGQHPPVAYDLSEDPQERFPDTLPITHPLRQALEAMGQGSAGAKASMNEDALRALGYLD